MAEVTISPIPYNGGTLIGSANRHICRLTESRFFCIYGQVTPEYTLGIVINVDDIRSATPISTILRTQTIPELAITLSSVAYRVYRLNDTDVVVFRQTVAATTFDISVLRIDPTTNVITKVGILLSRHQPRPMG